MHVSHTFGIFVHAATFLHSHHLPSFLFGHHAGKVSAFDGDAEGGENKKEKAPQSKGVLVTDTYAFNDQFT